ncbi:hypothetical protein [Sphingomonas sp.]|uniref:hypothetical protein n=1 Tax=Sphingomonas sp. TaxID=28214 RepID=UPI0025D03622|nr:hypothetical protein [Sphingomonas sp.]
MTKLLIERLDALANRTGIPTVYNGLDEMNPRRRPMRWLPILSITLGAIGIAMTLFGAFLGEIVVILGFLPSGWMPMFGPVKPLGWSKTVDERDAQVRSSAYLATLPVILIASVALIVLLPWRTSVVLQGTDDFDRLLILIRMSISATFFILIVWNSVPTLYASLKWPAEDEGDLED